MKKVPSFLPASLPALLVGSCLLTVVAALPAGADDAAPADHAAAPAPKPRDQRQEDYLAATRAANARIEALKATLTTLSATDPAAAVAKGKDFLQNDPDAKTRFPINIYNQVALIEADRANDVDGAVAMLDQAAKHLPPGIPQIVRCNLYLTRAGILTAHGRNNEAIAGLQAAWEDAVKTQKAAEMQVLLPGYVKALQQGGKDNEATDVILATAQTNLALLNQPAVWDQLTSGLLAAGHDDEALGWAKLRFMVCPYDETSITAATQVLSQIWLAKEMAPAKSKAFVKSQQDDAAPNPLKDVALPAIDSATIATQIARLAPAAYSERVTLLLATGDLRGAMLQARRILIERPSTNAGVLEVCRVFKAADLNLKRANAYLEFYRTDTGENPVTGFLKDNPASN